MKLKRYKFIAVNRLINYGFPCIYANLKLKDLKCLLFLQIMATICQ